jgi:hypothetical protein
MKILIFLLSAVNPIGFGYLSFYLGPQIQQASISNLDETLKRQFSDPQLSFFISNGDVIYRELAWLGIEARELYLIGNTLDTFLLSWTIALLIRLIVSSLVNARDFYGFGRGFLLLAPMYHHIQIPNLSYF